MITVQLQKTGVPPGITATFTRTQTYAGNDLDALRIELGADAATHEALLAQCEAEFAAYSPPPTQQPPVTTQASAGYQVSPSKIIIGPDGKRFVVRGAQMFDYLFASFEARTDMRYRAILNPADKGASKGISEPTYYGRVQYISADNVDRQIKSARNNGVNLIRIGVEAAVQFASVSYVDPTDGKTYPSDAEMLDTIIATADAYGMAVQLQSSNDNVGTADNIAFLKWLAARYFGKPNVWINPANEVNGFANGAADVNNPTVWLAEMRQYLLALREDIPGQPAGTKFRNPVAIDPPGYAYRLDLVAAAMASDAVFSADQNLIINIHYYSQAGESSFKGARLTTDTPRWVNYLQSHCVVIGEVGIDNFAGRYDPAIDASVPSVNTTAWAQMQAAVTDFVKWSADQCNNGLLQGVIGHMWMAYIPGMSMHDDNTMRRQDGTWTTWGTIFRDNFLTPRPAVQNTTMQAITGITTPVGHASIGTPLFQAEGVDGVRGAAMFVGHQVNSGYLGFYNRTANTLVGMISGNGSTGVTYGTSSDARLKTDIKPLLPASALRQVMHMRPVTARWRAHPDAPTEAMFLAHELEEVMPTAVAGERNGETFQTVDYGRITPLLAAAIQALSARVDEIESSTKQGGV